MSLILEALRKSEAERQRDNAPNVAVELPPVASRSGAGTPVWLWPLLAALLVLAALAGWLGLRAGKRDNAATVAAAQAPLAEPSPVASATPLPQIRPTVVAPRPEPALPHPVQSPPAAPPPTVDAIAPLPPLPAPVPPPLRTSTPPAALPARTASAPTPGAAPARMAPAPTLAAPDVTAPDISATNLPAVKLSMHMWDVDAAKRFVILDGQRMGEGDSIGGLQVIAIRRDGVIIERNGLRARVPLP